jgi:hypothetical protein
LTLGDPTRDKEIKLFAAPEMEGVAEDHAVINSLSSWELDIRLINQNAIALR